MRSRQAGITFIGWVFLLAPVAIVGYAAIRLTPIYLNYFKVAKAINQTASEYQGDSVLIPTEVRDSLDRRFNIEAVTYPEVKDIAVTRAGDVWALSVDYEDGAPLIGGISVVVHFQKRAVVK